ncbi:hypothetical protein HY486_01235 [Candidatus Woesearchaeota archaeon]|nr:hypothetical protein [Candidatus Woesearchaeota archaeon]
MREKLHFHPVASALAITTGILHTIFTIITALWPRFALQTANDWFPGTDFQNILTTKINIGSFIRGLIEIVIVSYLTGAILAWTYNKCYEHCKKRKWI